MIKRFWRHFTVAGLVVTLLSGCETAPISGRQQLVLLPEAQEVQMGLQAYQEILKKEQVSNNPEYNALVQRVGRRIAAASGENYQWEFKVLEGDNTVNAFALPGGKVGVYTGLIKFVDNEAQLAAVIGHEIAHATARHGGERVSQQMVAQVGLAATAAAMGNRDPGTVQAVTALLGAGATVGVLLPFSRLQEAEADRLGMVYMAKGGYDPRAARDLWVKMAQASRNRAKPPEILSTHPADETRIANIEKYLPEALSFYKRG
jgi:predicted Zn-dependent protease